MVKKRFFKTREDCEVAFEFGPAEAARVALVCDSNGWEPIEMKKAKSGAFRTTLRLPRGRRFQFRYLLDRTTWANDESADSYCRNEFGGENGILDTSPTS